MQRYHVSPRLTEHESIVFDVVDYVTGKPCFLLDGLPRQDEAQRRCDTLNEGYRTIRILAASVGDTTTG